MEKIHQPISIRLPAVKMFLDDIESIVKILTEEGAKGVTIEACGTRFNFDEITLLKKEKLYELKIIGHFANESGIYSDFSISFDNYSGLGAVRIYSHKNEIFFIGITKKIEDFLKERLRPLSILSGKIITASISGMLFPITVGIFFTSIKSKNNIYLIFFILSVLLLFISVQLSFNYKNIILLEESSKHKNYFKKHWEEISVQIFVGLILLIAGYFLGRISTK